MFVFDFVRTTDKQIEGLDVGFSVHTILGEILTIFYSGYNGVTFTSLPMNGKFKCKVSNFPFSVGQYYIGARIINNGVEVDWPRDFIGVVNVEAGDFYQNGSKVHTDVGTVLINGDWKLEEPGS